MTNPIAIAFLCLILCGCGTIRKVAMRQITGTLFDSSQADVFVQDNDPELIREAFPFTLKMLETLVAADPENQSLLLAASSGFIQYANAFVAQDAERILELDFIEAKRLQRRAAKLYLRGRDYALTALDLNYPNFKKNLMNDTPTTLMALKEEHVPLLFWAGAGWAGMISVDVNNMELIAQLRFVEAMMRRALMLDESFDSGALHEFFIAFDGKRSEAMGGSIARARTHFNRALELTKGQKASPYVTMATSVAIPLQDQSLFTTLLTQALEIKVDDYPHLRLVNVLSQEQAQWLLDHRADLFFDYEEDIP